MITYLLWVIALPVLMIAVGVIWLYILGLLLNALTS